MRNLCAAQEHQFRAPGQLSAALGVLTVFINDWQAALSQGLVARGTRSWHSYRGPSKRIPSQSKTRLTFSGRGLIRFWRTKKSF